MFIPDPHIYEVLVLLAIAFEVAKITSSTFLFHEASDKSFPFLFKIILLTLIASLMVLTAITTFSHLNSSANKNLTSSKFQYEQLSILKNDRERIIASSNNIDNRIKEIPIDLDPKKRSLQIEKLEKERSSKEEELKSINQKIVTLNEKISSVDDFAFLNSLSEILGFDRQVIFTYGILFIVVLIDPLSISLILAGTFLFEKSRKLYQENREDKKAENATVLKVLEKQEEQTKIEEQILNEQREAKDVIIQKLEEEIEEVKDIRENLEKKENEIYKTEESKNTLEESFVKNNPITIKEEIIEKDDEGNFVLPRKKKKVKEVVLPVEEVKEEPKAIELAVIEEPIKEEFKEVIQEEKIDFKELTEVINEEIKNKEEETSKENDLLTNRHKAPPKKIIINQTVGSLPQKPVDELL